MNGSGEYRDDGSVRFDVTFPRGRFRYDISAFGAWHVKGMIDGEAVDTSG
jgi:hypothetical protein